MAADSNIRGAGSRPVMACNSLRSVIGTAKQGSEFAGAIPVAAHSNCRRTRTSRDPPDRNGIQGSPVSLLPLNGSRISQFNPTAVAEELAEHLLSSR